MTTLYDVAGVIDQVEIEFPHVGMGTISCRTVDYYAARYSWTPACLFDLRLDKTPDRHNSLMVFGSSRSNYWSFEVEKKAFLWLHTSDHSHGGESACLTLKENGVQTWGVENIEIAPYTWFKVPYLLDRDKIYTLGGCNFIINQIKFMN